MNENGVSPDKPRYAWPWFVLMAVLFGFALAILWVGTLVKRLHEQRENNSAPIIQIVPATNAAIVNTNTFVYANPTKVARMTEV